MGFESQWSRMNCQIFSTGLSSDDFRGYSKRVIFCLEWEIRSRLTCRLIADERGVRSRCDSKQLFRKMKRWSSTICYAADSS
jgi:hypothetical protein